uniref:Uncharacterized protein n=1 Tax=Arundo donax TaxID=35708 RepID=A0A0A9EUS6_ARUDO
MTYQTDGVARVAVRSMDLHVFFLQALPVAIRATWNCGA